MNCREFEEHLEEIAEGRAPRGVLADASAHRSGCSRCRELEAMVRESLEALAVDPGVDLTASILAGTSGPACPAAEGRLLDRLDGALAGPDEELLLQHLAHCRPCDRLASALSFLAEELPRDSVRDPGPGFLADVLRATSRRPAPRWSAAAAIRAAALALARRPRFALEGAYVGAMILWLGFGAALQDVSAQVQRLGQINPAPVARAFVPSVPDFVRRPAEAGRSVWSYASNRVPSLGVAHTGAPEEKLRRVGALSKSLGRHGLGVLGGLARGRLDESAQHVGGMGRDLKEILRELSTRTKRLESNGGIDNASGRPIA